MLPSTGYFKGINCPFYDNGLCERPYCHFRHVKKESPNEGMESGAILQKLVSAAVQKVLQQTDTTTNTPQHSVNDGENPSKTACVQSVSKVTYNPTPIVELKKIASTDTEVVEEVSEQRKRHIPVPYTPRKPVSLSIKRPVQCNGDSKPFIYIPPTVTYSPGSNDSPKVDPYTPKGTSTIESKDKYLPGTEIELQEYTPKETTQQPFNKHSYIPSDKSVSKKILEYKPTKVNKKIATPSVTYRPTPRSQVPYFSSDEDEPDMKKRKLSTDLNGLDDLGPEFDILDQILDEEKTGVPKEDESKAHNDKPEKYKDSKSSKENKVDNEHCIKDDTKRKEKKHHSKERIDKKNKPVSGDKEKTEKRSREKSSKNHSSNNHNKSDKSRDNKKEKHCSDKKKHSNSSKRSDDSSKHSKSSSSKSSEKHSKHSSSSRSDSKSESKRRDKSDSGKSHRSSKDSKEKHKKRKDKSPSVHLSDNDNQNGDNLDLTNEDIYDESDEETIAMECKKIFEEYVPMEKPKIYEEIDNKIDDTSDEYVSSKKRISRTIDKNIKVIQKTPLKPDYKKSAIQTMAERLQKVREYHASKEPTPTTENVINKPDALKHTFNSTNVGSKIRIAHVPYASTLLNAKKTITPSLNPVKNEPSTSSTVVQTVKKGSQRVAHMPNEKFIDRPGVLEPLASKIPANIRSTYLNMMIDECLKLYLSATDAYARAQHEELTTSKKCSTVQIYKNSAVLAVSRLRKEFQECNGVKKSGSDCSALQSIPQGLSAKTNNAGSWSIVSKNRKSLDNAYEFSGAKLYNNIKKWILTEDQLKENGFPRPHASGEKGRAIIIGQNKNKPPNGYIRTCCRCKKDYTVNKKGFASVKEECIYHPNNKYRVRGEARYQCCSQDGTSDGCCIAPSHVYEYVDFENLKGYVRTMPPEKSMDDYGVYSLDCEMCYTTHGLDLTRVTVINSACKVVYETLIRPLHPIVDYNTRYSGITEEQMSAVKTTLLEVQATLLAMFNSKTILIGHSLESDFKALKLIHDSVIDTSVLFPHKMGPPYKRALRNLSSEYLKKIIQNSVDGHDSAEDATVCMELLHFKLKEDLKTR
ncbi:LOW QUALITY PROTEIN: uncharacterized protein ACR2FA_004670 [Aphomia sociella]